MKKEPTIWEATKTPGLYVRQPGGVFYARIYLDGKRSWRSLKTDKLRAAQKLLRDLQSGFTKQVSDRSDAKLHAAMAEVIAFRGVRRALKSKPLRKSTIAYHGEILASARKILEDRPLASFTTVKVLQAIQNCDLSQSRRKAVFELLKRTFSNAVENGVIKKSPVAGHIPGKVPNKERTLPTREQLEEMIRVIQKKYPRYGHRSAFTVRFLAFSGMRLDEAKHVKWKDVADGKIKIRGGEEGIKTLDAGQTRTLDINKPLQLVLDEIQGIYGRKDEARVIPALGIIPHLRTACKALKIPVINHHDLRSWFITWCITSLVDIATLAAWVGNSPAVLLEKYAAVQRPLKVAAADKLE